MPNPFTQLLAGLTGGFQGYAQQQTADEQRQRLNLQDTRQAANDRYMNEDRASQRALRDAQSVAASQKAQQDAYLRTPEFQQLYQAARGGDEQAVAHVASAVAGHPDAGTFMAPLVKQPKTHYDEKRGGMVDLEHNTFTATPGVTPEPVAPVMGSAGWKDAKKYEAGLIPRPEPLVPIKQPDGTVVYAPRSQAAGAEVGSTNSGVGNQAALRAKGVLPQFDQAATTLEKYDKPGAAGVLFSRNALGGYAMTAEGQNANQAAMQLARAYLSSQSTRIAPVEQVRALANEILIQPGEESNATVVTNKRSRRQTMRQEIATRAGTTGAASTGSDAPPATGNAFFKPKGGMP